MTSRTEATQILSDPARKEILEKLTRNLETPENTFKVPETMGVRSPHLTPVTEGPRTSPENLAILFGRQLDSISGSHRILLENETVTEAILEHIDHLRKDSRDLGFTNNILSWDPRILEIPDLSDTLSQQNIELVVPEDLHSSECRDSAANIRIGLTGVEAAMASTGTVSLSNGPGMNRAASLLPLHHILLIAQDRLYSNVEAWFETLREQNRLEEVLCDRSQLSLVTGPSKSADIGLTLTLGVHGPRTVHAIIYKNT